jgi:hypothetical protein
MAHPVQPIQGHPPQAAVVPNAVPANLGNVLAAAVNPLIPHQQVAHALALAHLLHNPRRDGA